MSLSPDKIQLLARLDQQTRDLDQLEALNKHLQTEVLYAQASNDTASLNELLPVYEKSFQDLRAMARGLMQTQAELDDFEGARARILSAPGTFVLVALPYFFSRKTIERVFAQALADMREEYFAALAAERPWLARAVRVRWVVGLVNTIVLQWGVSLAKQVHAIWKLGGGG